MKATARFAFSIPSITLLLNIEEEHLDFYADLAAIESVFAQLLGQTRGKVFYCADDANAKRLCERRPATVSFGFAEGADYRGTDVELKDFASVFCVFRRGEQLGEAILSVPGRHNVSNALGVIALAMELGIPFEKIKKSLARFEHARRRVSKSNTKASAFSWSMITDTIPPRFAPLWTRRDQSGGSAC